VLTKPDIADDTIRVCLHADFGLRVAQVTFLPIGWVNNAAYRVTDESGTAYFLKLRRGNFDETAVAVPAFLHAQGIREVMAPLAAAHGIAVQAHGFTWLLYPYFDGKSGFAAALSQAQWIGLGESMQAIHATPLPAALAARVPKEDFAPRWRNRVKAFDAQVAKEGFDDPVAASLAAFWRAQRDEIASMVARAEQLASVVQKRAAPLTICHADLHAGNVLLGGDNAIAIVDWDEPILAPKERDLMFIGGGIGGAWHDEQEARWFYRGYGRAQIDLFALSYYRYERIVVDIAEYAAQIFGMQGSVEEREKGLAELVSQFSANDVVEIAHRTYQLLA
jgi:spectinomycin phosphotransferase